MMSGYRRVSRVAIAATLLLFVAAHAASPPSASKRASLPNVVADAPWTQQAKLLAADAANNDYAGRAVAISGDTAVIGAAGADDGDNQDLGAAYVYVRSGGTWLPQAKLLAVDGVGGDEFGFAVAISGDTLVVGARFASIDGHDGQGAAYVFVRSGTAWTQQSKLASADGIAFDGFGNSVAIDADTVIVGAQNASVNGNTSQGAAYVFTRNGSDWTAQAKLSASDGAAWVQFARAVSVRGDSAVIGAVSATIGANAGQGAAYVFTRDGGNWSERAKLVAQDGEPWSGFGGAVALDAGQAIIGSSDTGIAGQGAAYVFAGSGSSWTQQAKLTADDAFNGDAFGWSVALSGGTAVVGSLFADLPGVTNTGAAYVYARAAGVWTQQAKLVADDSSQGAEFGIGVALDGTHALVGAEFAAGESSWPGAGYVFESANTCAHAPGESFDGVSVPALPAGWTFTAANGSAIWHTVNDSADTAPNAVFVPDVPTPSDVILDSPIFAPQAGAMLSFRHHYDLEPTYDGGVLEISIAGAPFVDFVDAGGSFVEGGYSDTMIGGSAIAGRAAWTGDSGGAFVTVTAMYPPTAIGQPLRLRWRAASDVSAAHQGWWIDTISFGCATLPQATASVPQSQLAFSVPFGASASDTLTLLNIGDAGSALQFALDEASDAQCSTLSDAPWLVATPAAGDVAAGMSQDIDVGVDANGLAAGTHVASICVHTSDAAHALIAVPVTLNVGADPDMIFANGFDAP
jgi:hypothetical protein